MNYVRLCPVCSSVCSYCFPIGWSQYCSDQCRKIAERSNEKKHV